MNLCLYKARTSRRKWQSNNVFVKYSDKRNFSRTEQAVRKIVTYIPGEIKNHFSHLCIPVTQTVKFLPDGRYSFFFKKRFSGITHFLNYMIISLRPHTFVRIGGSTR